MVMFFPIVNSVLNSLVLTVLLVTLVQVSTQMNPDDSSLQNTTDALIGPPRQSRNLTFLDTLRNQFSSGRRYRPFVNSEPGLNATSKINCYFSIPSRSFASSAPQIYVAVNDPLPGPPPFQPFAAYGKTPYWFLNDETGWEVRITPEIGLSWINLGQWWDMDLRQSVLGIVQQCVARTGVGGRQRWSWHDSDNSMNPDTRIMVEVLRADADELGRPSRGICGICS